LFSFGVGYGLLVTRFHSGQTSALSLDEAAAGPGYNWGHLALWGTAGVVLGGLLPWFDGVWEGAFGPEENLAVKGEARVEKTSPQTDWAPVVRCIGAFVGIAFAIVSPSRRCEPSNPIAPRLMNFTAKTAMDFYDAGLIDSGSC
jgi:hypothetical protein